MTHPNITFYEIPDKDPDMVYRATCKLASEYYRAQTNVHILTDDEATLTKLDETLWNYPVYSFVPHIRAATRQAECIVTMDSMPHFEGEGSVLINLTANIPRCVEQFDTVCEFVLQREVIKQQARSRFVRYREQYGTPTFVDLPVWDSRPILT